MSRDQAIRVANAALDTLNQIDSLLIESSNTRMATTFERVLTNNSSTPFLTLDQVTPGTSIYDLPRAPFEFLVAAALGHSIPVDDQGVFTERWYVVSGSPHENEYTCDCLSACERLDIPGLSKYGDEHRFVDNLLLFPDLYEPLIP